MKKFNLILAFTLAFGLMACGDDSSSGPSDNEKENVGENNGDSSSGDNESGVCNFTESGDSFTMKFNNGMESDTYTQSGEKVSVSIEFYKGAEATFCEIYMGNDLYSNAACNGSTFTADLNLEYFGVGYSFDDLKKRQKNYCETGMISL